MLSGGNFGDNFAQSFWSGMLSGAIGGGISGGIVGYNNALKAGKNVWWGGEVKYNRNQWSFTNTNKPDYEIEKRYHSFVTSGRLFNVCNVVIEEKK